MRTLKRKNYTREQTFVVTLRNDKGRLSRQFLFSGVDATQIHWTISCFQVTDETETIDVRPLPRQTVFQHPFELQGITNRHE
jgi:hypothetical protein